MSLIILADVEQSLKTFQITQRKGVTSLRLTQYYNRTYSYVLRHPDDWEVTQLQKDSTVKFVYDGDNTKLTLLVSAEKLADDIDLERYPHILRYTMLCFLILVIYTTLLKTRAAEAASDNSTLSLLPASLGGFKAYKTSFYSESLLIPGKYSQGITSAPFIAKRNFTYFAPVWTVQNRHAGVLTFIHSIEVSRRFLLFGLRWLNNIWCAL